MGRSSFSLKPVKISVIGLGYGGSCAVTCTVRDGIEGVETIAMDTDTCALAIAEASTRVLFGEGLFHGFGTNGNDRGSLKAAGECRGEIREVIDGAEMVFIVAGMGGGAGTGSAPVVAEVAKECGALTIAIVTKPFGFEGERCKAIAENGIKTLLPLVDTTITIPNDKLFTSYGQKLDYDKAFRRVNEVVVDGVQAITRLITVPGMINLDLSAIGAVIKSAGPARISIGIGSGQDRATNAAKAALASPLLDVPLSLVRGAFFNVSGCDNLTLPEISQATEIIKQAVDPNAKIKFGSVPDSRTNTDIKVTLIVTGFETASIQTHS